MTTFLEPVYLNEKMVLNCAAYLFRGVPLESNETESTSTEGKGSIHLGMEFLKGLLPFSGETGLERMSKHETQTARRYTLGGLHMTLLDELRRKKEIDQLNVEKMSNTRSHPYVELIAVLKPVDFFNIIETVQVLSPLIFRILNDFGSRISPAVFNDNVTRDLPKYEDAISSVLRQLESDYLKSNQLEMVMVDSDTDKQIGVLDIDVTDYDPSEVKARLTGGQFHVFGKITKTVSENESISLVERTFLSIVMHLLEKLMSLSSTEDNMFQYNNAIATAKPFIDKICQLQIPGPACRATAMSVCV